jgi:outer membrane receptor protein involved in Fe transport
MMPATPQALPPLLVNCSGLIEQWLRIGNVYGSSVSNSVAPDGGPLSRLCGADLDKSSVQSVSDALSMVPGVAVNVTGQGGETKLTIRGVTAAGSLFAGPSPIGYYLDSVPFGLVRSAVQPYANSYDLNRIEVLRGPQGTLYGASALNGVVRVLTNDADLNDFDFKARASVSSTESGGGNWREDAAVNLPIVDGKLAARLVVGQEHDSGWINSPIGNNINDGDLKNIRLKVNAQPIDDLSIKLGATHEEANFGAPPQGTDDFTASTKDQRLCLLRLPVREHGLVGTDRGLRALHIVANDHFRIERLRPPSRGHRERHHNHRPHELHPHSSRAQARHALFRQRRQ